MIWPDALSCFVRGQTMATGEKCTMWGKILDDGDDPAQSGQTAGQAADQYFHEGTYACAPSNSNVTCPSPQDPYDETCKCEKGMYASEMQVGVCVGVSSYDENNNNQPVTLLAGCFCNCNDASKAQWQVCCDGQAENSPLKDCDTGETKDYVARRAMMEPVCADTPSGGSGDSGGSATKTPSTGEGDTRYRSEHSSSPASSSPPSSSQTSGAVSSWQRGYSTTNSPPRRPLKAKPTSKSSSTPSPRRRAFSQHWRSSSPRSTGAGDTDSGFASVGGASLAREALIVDLYSLLGYTSSSPSITTSSSASSYPSRSQSPSPQSSSSAYNTYASGGSSPFSSSAFKGANAYTANAYMAPSSSSVPPSPSQNSVLRS